MFKEVIKQSLFIAGFNLIPYYVGKNYSKFERIFKSNKNFLLQKYR
jgi:hypothetical protein